LTSGQSGRSRSVPRSGLTRTFCLHKLGQAPNPQPEGQWSEPVRDTQAVGFLGKPGAKNPSRQHHRRPRIPSIRYYLSKSEVPRLPPWLAPAAPKRARAEDCIQQTRDDQWPLERQCRRSV
jgi:hypothetical protein